MKIKELKVFTVGNPPPHFGGRYWNILKIITDSGISGIGEAYSVPFHPSVVEKMIKDVFERHVLNKDPFKIEKLYRNIFSTGYSQRPDLSIMGILSAFEMACWDIVGKDLNKPIYELLGGKVHEKLRTYTYLYPKKNDKKNVYSDGSLAAERANEYLKQGFTAIKFDPLIEYTVLDPKHLSIKHLNKAEEYIKKVRDSVKNNCDLLIGTHGQMTPSSAIQFAKLIEKYKPMWFEEPIPPSNFDSMGFVAKNCSIPIATGERLSTKYEFNKILQINGANIIQMNLGRVGGILEAKKIAALAEIHFATIAPHLYCGPVIGAANIQISTCSPNFLILESIKKWENLYSDLLIKPIQWQDGFIIPPVEPGLGIELNEEVAIKYPYKDSKLHLEMKE
jgi:2-dehydro-3-deoxyphosphogalactonate aldolase